MKLLFICGRNRRRSPTAEIVVGKWPGVEVDSAGVRADADTVVSLEQVHWADLVVLMDRAYRRPLTSLFGAHLRDKRVVSLDIKDDYELMDAHLVELIEQRLRPLLRLSR